jgi:hypothetical protein
LEIVKTINRALHLAKNAITGCFKILEYVKSVCIFFYLVEHFKNCKKKVYLVFNARLNSPLFNSELSAFSSKFTDRFRRPGVPGNFSTVFKTLLCVLFGVGSCTLLLRANFGCECRASIWVVRSVCKAFEEFDFFVEFV